MSDRVVGYLVIALVASTSAVISSVVLRACVERPPPVIVDSAKADAARTEAQKNDAAAVEKAVTKTTRAASDVAHAVERATTQSSLADYLTAHVGDGAPPSNLHSAKGDADALEPAPGARDAAHDGGSQ